MPASEKRLSREERKELILTAARQVFINRGYKGATTAEIAESAAISEVTLFRHFSSKQELFIEAVEPALTEGLYKEIQNSNHLDPMERLRNVLTERINFVSQNHQLVKLVLMENNIHDELFHHNIIEKITELVKKLIDSLGIEEGKKELTLRMLMGVYFSFLYMPEASEDKIALQVEQMVSRICTKD